MGGHALDVSGPRLAAGRDPNPSNRGQSRPVHHLHWCVIWLRRHRARWIQRAVCLRREDEARDDPLERQGRAADHLLQCAPSPSITFALVALADSETAEYVPFGMHHNDAGYGAHGRLQTTGLAGCVFTPIALRCRRDGPRPDAPPAGDRRVPAGLLQRARHRRRGDAGRPVEGHGGAADGAAEAPGRADGGDLAHELARGGAALSGARAGPVLARNVNLHLHACTPVVAQQRWQLDLAAQFGSAQIFESSSSQNLLSMSQQCIVFSQAQVFIDC